MDTAVISAASALAGSVFDGLTSGVTTLMAYRIQARAGHRLHPMAQHEDLYKDFIATTSATYGNAILKSEPEIQDFVVL